MRLCDFNLTTFKLAYGNGMLVEKTKRILGVNSKRKTYSVFKSYILNILAIDNQGNSARLAKLCRVDQLSWLVRYSCMWPPPKERTTNEMLQTYTRYLNERIYFEKTHCNWCRVTRHSY